MTYPMHPTEQDRERFRDYCKSYLTFCDFNRIGIDGDYKSTTTRDMFRIWWSVEKERQLLHNLNQSQGAEISRLMSKMKKLEQL